MSAPNKSYDPVEVAAELSQLMLPVVPIPAELATDITDAMSDD